MARYTHPEIKDLVEAVKDVFGINAMSRTRRREIVDARKAIMVSSRTMFTTTDIGDAFGMNHSSVVHADKQHEDKYNLDSSKRHRSYRFYCDVYDFCQNRVREKKWKQYVTLSDVKDELTQEKQIRYGLEAKVKEQTATITKMKRDIKAMEKYKTAFLQFMKEKKAKDEVTA